MKIIFLILFIAISAFPSVGTSTGVIRQKSCIKELHKNIKRKFYTKSEKHLSMKEFLKSLDAMKIEAK